MKAAGISALVPNQFSNGDGKVTWLGWALFGITVTALVYNIVQSHQNIKATKEKEDRDSSEISELRKEVQDLKLKVACGNRSV